MLAAGVAAGLGQLVGLRPVHPPLVREEQQPVVRGAHEEVRDEVVLLERRALHAAPAALLGAVEVGLGALRVAGARDGDDDVLDGDEVGVGDLAVVADEAGQPLVPVLLDDLAELVADDLPLALRPVEDVLQVADRRLDLGQLVDDLLALEGGQATELHVEDGLGLELVDLEELDQAVPGDVDGLRRADEGDDLVERVERLDEPAQDVGPLLGLAQAVAGPPDDDLDLVADPVPDELVEPQRARDAVDDRQHVDAEAVLQLRVLVEVVQHHLRHGVAAQGDDDAAPDPVARLVVDLGDPGHPALADHRRDRLDEVVRVDLVRQLGDDEGGAALRVLLDLDHCAHADRPAPGAVGRLDAVACRRPDPPSGSPGP